MEKTNQLICLIGFVLVMATCMTGTVVNQRGMGHRSKHAIKDQYEDCLNTTIRRHACHGDTCHNTNTYIHGCNIYNDDDECDNLTVRFDVYNSTNWRNTTCYLYACAGDAADNCDNATLLFRSCTNGDCRGGTTDIYGCYSSSSAMNNFGDVSGLDIEDGLDDIFDIPCINLLFDTYRRSRFGSGK